MACFVRVIRPVVSILACSPGLLVESKVEVKEAVKVVTVIGKRVRELSTVEFAAELSSEDSKLKQIRPLKKKVR